MRCFKRPVIACFIFSIVMCVMLRFTVAAAASTVSSESVISATIGEHHFTLFGYASPSALITIQGMGIQDQTFADDTGYFIFKNRFTPLSSQEACLTAQDQFGRVSAPTCIPPFPNEYDVTIGPVILPATTSLDKNTYYTGDQVVLSGQTIPNSDVDLNVFTDQNTPVSLLDFHIVRPAHAASLPNVKARSDANGNFSAVLPSAQAKLYRLFTQTQFQDNLSPKSITLNLTVFPLWMIIVRFFGLIFSLIFSRIIEIVIISQLVLLAWYIYRHYFHPHRIRALMIREEHALTTYD